MGVSVNCRSVFGWMLRLVIVCLLLPLFVSCSHQLAGRANKKTRNQLYVVSWRGVFLGKYFLVEFTHNYV